MLIIFLIGKDYKQGNINKLSVILIGSSFLTTNIFKENNQMKSGNSKCNNIWNERGFRYWEAVGRSG